MINDAKQYVIESVINPALESENLSEEIKNKVRNSLRLVERFNRIGDLWNYLKRFNTEDINNYSEPDIYHTLKEVNLLTFEDIREGFKNNFYSLLDDCTTVSSFIIGETYSTFDIIFSAKKYDTRAGGILLVGDKPNYNSVIIKATLHGGKYKNEWIEEGKLLKYYFKSINTKFSDDYLENKVILNNPSIPIYTFVRNDKNENFEFNGVFKYASDHTSKSGARWFILNKDNESINKTITAGAYQNQLDKDVHASSKDTSDKRIERLALVNKKPKKVYTLTPNYYRNPDVIAEVLHRANGICETCKQGAPFNKKSTGQPYLEVHHRLPLSKGGEDSVDNAIALCPNCHRRAHYG